MMPDPVARLESFTVNGALIWRYLHRYFTEDKIDLIAVIAGIVQTALYSDFFYIYYTKVLKGQKFELPA